MSAVAITGLVQIDLPERSIRLCDGGFFEYQGETFEADDPVFGTIGSVASLSEGVGDSIPALTMTMLPASTAAPADMLKPGYQTSRVRFWIAEYDVATGQILSADVQFDGQLDQAQLTVGAGERTLETSVVSLMERVFEGDIGNTLNSEFHRSIWPGERGHDNATGLSRPVAWGVESPRSSYGGGRSYTDGGGPSRARDFRQY